MKLLTISMIFVFSIFLLGCGSSAPTQQQVQLAPSVITAQVTHGFIEYHEDPVREVAPSQPLEVGSKNKEPQTQEVSLYVLNSGFVPPTMIINKGDTLRLTSYLSTPVTISLDHYFSAEPLATAGTIEVTMGRIGVYELYCEDCKDHTESAYIRVV